MQTKPTWGVSKRKQLEYGRHDPTQSVLYRVVYHCRQELEYCWEERYQQHYGVFRKEVGQAYDAYLNCGLLLHGCAVAKCESSRCSHSQLIPLSCKERGVCPSCDVKRAHIFAQHLHDNVLLAEPHGHLVFTIPVRLRAFFRYNRKLNQHLYRCAWEAWQEYVEEVLPGCRAGAVMTLHPTGDLLHHHPHIHGMGLYGGVDEGGQFHELPSVDTDHLEELFRSKVLAALLEEELLTQDDVDCMNSWENSGFSVFVGEPVAADDRDARLFLARYLKKAPIALERLELIEKEGMHQVRIHSSFDDKALCRDFDPLDFLAELSLTVPGHREQTTRYYGIYSARTRGAKRRAEFLKQRQSLKQAGQDPASVSFEPPPRPSKAWLTWIKKVYHVDPLVCPKCGSRMKITAFIHSQNEIKRICQNLNIIPWKIPPPIKVPQSLPAAA